MACVPEKVVVILNRGNDQYEIQTAETGKDVVRGTEGKTFSLKAQSFIWIHLPDTSDYNAFVKIPKSRERR